MLNSPITGILTKNILITVSAALKSLIDLSHYAEDNIADYKTVTEIPQTNLDYLNNGLRTNNMYRMFFGCQQLTTIPELNIDTSQCTDMEYMFCMCTNLTSVNISNLNTSFVTNMQQMFSNCAKLTSIDVSNFDTSNVTKMGSMFGNCFALQSLDISKFDTSKTVDMSSMFKDCSALTTIIGTIDMKSCTIYTDMFKDCSKLTGVKIKNPPSGFDGAGLLSEQYTIVS